MSYDCYSRGVKQKNGKNLIEVIPTTVPLTTTEKTGKGSACAAAFLDEKQTIIYYQEFIGNFGGVKGLPSACEGTKYESHCEDFYKPQIGNGRLCCCQSDRCNSQTEEMHRRLTSNRKRTVQRILLYSHFGIRTYGIIGNRTSCAVVRQPYWRSYIN